jgi:hypothetical protein
VILVHFIIVIVCSVHDSGNTELKLDVTSEDGAHWKSYIVNIRRLSPQDAKLAGISASAGKLYPDFQPHVNNYTLIVEALVQTVTFSVTKADEKITAYLGKRPLTDALALTSGETPVSIYVVAADGVTSAAYDIVVIRERIIESPSLTPTAEAVVQCPVCLNVMHRPKQIASCPDKHLFCDSCIAILTRNAKTCPIDGSVIAPDGIVSFDRITTAVDVLSAKCFFHGNGCSVISTVAELPAHVINCDYYPVLCPKCNSVVSRKTLDSHQLGCWKSCAKCDRSFRSSESEKHDVLYCNFANEVAHKIVNRFVLTLWYHICIA